MIGLLVMAYGGPDKLEDVEPYLLDVRGYRPTSQEIIHEVRERYREIGGRSPILEQTQAQADALESALNSNGNEFKVYVGMRHWHPFIKDALAEMQAQGIEKAVGVVMAPHYSRMSIGAYYQRLEEANSPIAISRIENWHLEAGYIHTLANRVRAALQRFPEEIRADIPVIFTAHSLPEKILEWNDPYPAQLRETVSAVMEKLGSQPHEFAFQSAAISTIPWLGPDAGEVIESLVAKGKKHILLCPIGFVCEHVEILYDIDIVYQNLARSLGIHLERIEMLNTAPEMIAGLADSIREKVKEAGWL
ncbi:MAG: ferrochelatase [Anaerolineales bacterium]|nr:MAG: ferrochelatase [Anaerolineales bacterium]